jgi:hypothetical protein
MGILSYDNGMAGAKSRKKIFERRKQERLGAHYKVRSYKTVSRLLTWMIYGRAISNLGMESVERGSGE